MRAFRLALSHGRRRAGPGGGTPDRRRTVHVSGLFFLSTGRCAARRAREPSPGAGAVLPCRLLGQARLEGALLPPPGGPAPARPRPAPRAPPAVPPADRS